MRSVVFIDLKCRLDELRSTGRAVQYRPGLLFGGAGDLCNNAISSVLLAIITL